METGECLKVLKGHTNRVTCLFLSADGRRVVSGSNDATLRIWDIETGECLNVLKGHTSRVHSLVQSADGRRVVSGSNDATLRIWDIETGECLFVVSLRGVSSITYQSETGKISAGFSDGRVEFYDFENLPLGPFITTAQREIISENISAEPATARPPCCGQAVRIPEPICERIEHWANEGGEGGYTDPALILDCPHCQTPLRMNPFFANVQPLSN